MWRQKYRKFFCCCYYVITIYSASVIHDLGQIILPGCLMQHSLFLNGRSNLCIILIKMPSSAKIPIFWNHIHKMDYVLKFNLLKIAPFSISLVFICMIMILGKYICLMMKLQSDFEDWNLFKKNELFYIINVHQN